MSNFTKYDSISFQNPGFGYVLPYSVNDALSICIASNDEILSILLKNKKEEKEENEEMEENEESNKKEEKELEPEELSEEIINGFNNDLNKMTKSELQNLLLQHKTYPYIRTTQATIKVWNAWKIKKITKKIADFVL